MNRYPTYIDAKTVNACRFYLWSYGNYQYEIADFKNKVHSKMECSFDQAKQAFIAFSPAK
jgi:hypothetical protein